MAKVFLRAYNREIETMIDRGQLDEAIAHGHHILKTFPKHLETYRLLGKAYLEAKRYADAVDVFSRVLASVPNDFVSHVGLSIIRDEENKLDEAIWHMERAFETQPSNSAIQSELQRLYGRRDGVSPPRIRMTRGALAHMYVQGELYPQAISEIKSVLKEDPGRNDMQALLARASFKSGAKNDAVDAALALLQRLPYALDGNRVLVEVLSADRNENAQAYRQRVVELDPYAAQVTANVFQSNEVSDAAVSLERLDWNGQPVGTGSDWRESQGISLESGRARDEQPDWLKGPSGSVTPPPLTQPSSAFSFETPASTSPTPAQPADEIPEFLKVAGWGQSTGAFDESKSMFAAEEPSAGIEPLAEGDLPDWVKAMKPPEQATPAEDEELPDWINKIGTGALGASAAQPEWMSQSEESQQTFPTPATDQPDWLKGFGDTQEPAQPAQDQPDWLHGFGSADVTSQAAETDTPDWLKGLSSEPDVTPQPAQTGTSDWLKGLGSESEVTPQPAQTDTPDWLEGLGSEAEPDITPQPAQTETPDWLASLGSEPAVSAAQSDDDWMKQLTSTTEDSASASKEFDFLNELTEEPVAQAPQEIAQPSSTVDDLGKSEQERDDSFAWLENLAAKQGATEGLLTTPEERLQDEPEWVKQAKGLTGEPASTQPAVNVGDLGKTEQERDDSFAWLENLAAKQGATEGLLTKPEERMEQEPEWVRLAKGLSGEPPVSQPPVNAEELGKSEQERDDSFAWLENLAAKQGATEGLLTKPEERMEQEPEWVKQARSAELESPVSQPPVNAEEPGKSEEERDDSFAWLENLAAKQDTTEGLLTTPEERLQEEPEWMEQVTSTAPEPPMSQPVSAEELGKSEQERDDSFAWLENLAAKQGATEGLLTKPEERMEQEPEWVRLARETSAQEPVPPSPQEEPLMEQPASTEDPDAWLKSFEEEKQPGRVSAADETAIWLKKLEQEETGPEPVPAADETAIWLKSLEQADEVAAEPSAEPVDSDMPAWMRDIAHDQTPAAEPAVPMQELEPIPDEPAEEPSVPSWLSDLDQEEKPTVTANADDLPAWLRDETGEVVAEPVKIEPTRPTDWKPFEPKQPEVQYDLPVEEQPQEPEIQYSPAVEEEPKQPEIIYSPPLEQSEPEPVMPTPSATFEEPSQPVPVPSVTFEEPPQQPAPPQPEQPKPARKAPSRPMPEPVARRGTGMLAMPGTDPTLGNARGELSRSNIPGALESYARLIKKGRFLEEVIYDLREALYRYPVEVSIWQSLGDAYMRANRLQDALDAYTKAEELLR